MTSIAELGLTMNSASVEMAAKRFSAVVIEAPDGTLHGKGGVIASADAYLVRPQDCAPELRSILFGYRLRA